LSQSPAREVHQSIWPEPRPDQDQPRAAGHQQSRSRASPGLSDFSCHRIQMNTQVYKLYLNGAISKMGAGQQKRVEPSSRLSGGPVARRVDLFACVQAEAGSRVLLPQATEPWGLTRTRFSRPLIKFPPSHVKQPRPPSTLSELRTTLHSAERKAVPCRPAVSPRSHQERAGTGTSNRLSRGKPNPLNPF